jgi:hypothetical protein
MIKDLVGLKRAEQFEAPEPYLLGVAGFRLAHRRRALIRTFFPLLRLADSARDDLGGDLGGRQSHCRAARLGKVSRHPRPATGTTSAAAHLAGRVQAEFAAERVRRIVLRALARLRRLPTPTNSKSMKARSGCFASGPQNAKRKRAAPTSCTSFCENSASSCRPIETAAFGGTNRPGQVS